MGNDVTDQLFVKFDKQISGVAQEIDNFEGDLKDWELSMQRDLTLSNQAITKFNSDCEYSLAVMGTSVNEKFKLT